jgi:CheY-like chemotaxis protein
LRILYVEDNEVNRKVISQMLSAGAVQMDEAEDGAAGLAMVQDHDYDLILMDLRMPRMDGLTAIRHLRARTDGKATLPVIVITADIATEVQANCRAAGADDVLQKPVSMVQLFDAIGRLLAAGDSGAVLA